MIMGDRFVAMAVWRLKHTVGVEFRERQEI